jgi:hypothetical protein
MLNIWDWLNQIYGGTIMNSSTVDLLEVAKSEFEVKMNSAKNEVDKSYYEGMVDGLNFAINQCKK